MMPEPLMQELKAITDYLDTLDKDWRKKIANGVSGTMTPAEVIGYVTPVCAEVNIRREPQIADNVVRKLRIGTSAAVTAQTFVITSFEGGKNYMWHELEDGGFVRQDVVIFSKDKPTPPIKASSWPAPISGYSVTNTHHNERNHVGIDLAAPIGAPVLSAPNEGYVMKAFHCLPCGNDPQKQTHMGTSDEAYGFGLGNYVVARYYDHPAYNRGHFLYVLYAHLSRIHVQEKQSLSPYTVIGEVGTSGNSTGPHLHIECRYSDNPLADFYAIRANEIDPSTIFKVN